METHIQNYRQCTDGDVKPLTHSLQKLPQISSIQLNNNHHIPSSST